MVIKHSAPQVITGCRGSTTAPVLRNRLRNQGRLFHLTVTNWSAETSGRAGNDPTASLLAARSRQQEVLATLICRAGHPCQERTELGEWPEESQLLPCLPRVGRIKTGSSLPSSQNSLLQAGRADCCFPAGFSFLGFNKVLCSAPAQLVR